jgi:hypothetical protein
MHLRSANDWEVDITVRILKLFLKNSRPNCIFFVIIVRFLNQAEKFRYSSDLEADIIIQTLKPLDKFSRPN